MCGGALGKGLAWSDKWALNNDPVSKTVLQSNKWLNDNTLMKISPTLGRLGDKGLNHPAEDFLIALAAWTGAGALGGGEAAGAGAAGAEGSSAAFASNAAADAYGMEAAGTIGTGEAGAAGAGTLGTSAAFDSAGAADAYGAEVGSTGSYGASGGAGAGNLSMGTETSSTAPQSGNWFSNTFGTGGGNSADGATTTAASNGSSGANYASKAKTTLGTMQLLSSLYGMEQSRKLSKQAAPPDYRTLPNMPGYQAGLEAVQRSLAAQGYQGSGNMMAALQKYGGDAYMQNWQGNIASANAGANPLLYQMGSLGLAGSGLQNIYGTGGG